MARRPRFTSTILLRMQAGLAPLQHPSRAYAPPPALDAALRALDTLPAPAAAPKEPKQ